MISVVKYVRLLLLPWLLFMASNCIVNFVAAIGMPISQRQLQQQQQQQQQEALFAPQQQQQPAWYHQQLQQQQKQPAISLSAPTPATIAQLPAEASKTTAADNFTTSTLPNGVDYSNETVGYTDETVSEDDEKLPSEIQKAVCTVTAGEVRASAEAVTTKKLKGVCGSAELKLAFSDLEAKLYKELQDIKILLQHIAQQQGINMPQQLLAPMTFATTTITPPAVSHAQQRTNIPTTSYAAATSTTPSPTTQTTTTQHAQQHKPTQRVKPTTANKPKFQPIVESKANNAVDTSSAEVSYEYEESSAAVEAADDLLPRKLPQLKSFHTKSQPLAPISSELLQEVRKFNNTMLSDRELKVFTYYWKLENFTERIESGRSSMVESPVFSIKGKPLHLIAYFQHLHRDFLYLQLTQALKKSSNPNNIFIDMGGLFKEIANDKISFKHKISVLNQHNQRSKDLTSQELHNLETGFIIPNSALLNSPFIKNDSLLIQIFLYL
ncbi:integrator complex subunit 3 homolog [Zeugodacus cucurbitae]|uniref:integrator complex subunit 3 homolog n=1 Tax=Zeugodacus cucurbitae TaxID=28588 RepID=UPI0023D9655D|nr:integrator complex subunit 3 homolog [Zeugodacus cucurbitae]